MMPLRRSKRARSFTPPRLSFSVTLLLLFSIVHKASSFAASNKPNIVVSVCQNKDCCQRFGLSHANLVQTLQHLLPANSAVKVEATGCQSKCDRGPNLSINDKPYEDVGDGKAAAAVLEMALDDVKVPPALLAAVTVMEKAHRASSPDQKEKLLNSVIKVLDATDDTVDSAANAHAHSMRAEVRLNQSRPQEARDDALRATQLSPTHPTAWRILADAQEATGNTLEAMEALTQWSRLNPQFLTKVNKEKARLASKACS